MAYTKRILPMGSFKEKNRGYEKPKGVWHCDMFLNELTSTLRFVY